MRVIKRSGRIEDMRFDNVTNRIKNLTSGLSDKCDSQKIAQQVFSSMYDNITTQEIDVLSAEICIGLITSDPDYEVLATRIIASNIFDYGESSFIGFEPQDGRALTTIIWTHDTNTAELYHVDIMLTSCWVHVGFMLVSY